MIARKCTITPLRHQTRVVARFLGHLVRFPRVGNRCFLSFCYPGESPVFIFLTLVPCYQWIPSVSGCLESTLYTYSFFSSPKVSLSVSVLGFPTCTVLASLRGLPSLQSTTLGVLRGDSSVARNLPPKNPLFRVWSHRQPKKEKDNCGLPKVAWQPILQPPQMSKNNNKKNTKRKTHSLLPHNTTWDPSPCCPFTTPLCHLHSFRRPSFSFFSSLFSLSFFFVSSSPDLLFPTMTALLLALSPRRRQDTSHPCHDAIIPSPLFISMATITVTPCPGTNHYTSAPMDLPHSHAATLPPLVDTHHACTVAVSFSSPS